MKRHLLQTLRLVLFLALASVGPLHAESGFFLKEMPDRDVIIEENPATPDEAKRIKNLIQELAATDAPDIGYSASASGDGFGPLPDLTYRGSENITAHHLKHSATLERLVAFGPKALPFLLDALADKSPTQLTLHSIDYHKASAEPGRPAIGLLLTTLNWQTPDCPVVPAREILYNPLNGPEARALKTADVIRMTSVGGLLGDCKAKLPTAHIKDQSEYLLTVGDLCLVAVGQITNRPYPAARYQGTGHTFINSPAHDPEIAKAVRSVWAKKTYRRQLFDSLLIDFHTRGRDDRGGSDRLQIGAATRLLYYFPDQAGAVVAQRLHELHVGTDIDLQSSEDEEANGIRAAELLEAVAFSENTEVRRELLDVFRRTADQEIALATFPGIDRDRRAEVLAKLQLFLRALPQEEKSLYGDGYKLLEAARKHLRNDQADLFQRYLKNAGAQRRTTVCRVLVLDEDWAKELAVDLLTPWLEDKSDAFMAPHDINVGFLGKHRICDEAALALVFYLEDIPFDPKGQLDDRDKQIENIRKELSKASRRSDADPTHQASKPEKRKG